jgi:hypothetical protein
MYVIGLRNRDYEINIGILKENLKRGRLAQTPLGFKQKIGSLSSPFKKGRLKNQYTSLV